MKASELIQKIDSGEIDTVIVAFPDVFGRLVGKRFAAKYYKQSIADHGTHGCNYLLTVNIEMEPMNGFRLANWEAGFGDYELVPDVETIRLLPWQPATALVICDALHEEKRPVVEAPRSVLRRQLDRLSEAGLVCKIASELEFFLYHQTFHDAFTNGYSKLTAASDYRIDYHILQPTLEEPLFRDVRNLMEVARVPVESSKGEWGRGQHEVNFVYDDPLPMADMHVVFKHGMKELAMKHGKCVTFMAKPSAGDAGSSCHIHVSLWKDGENRFWEKEKKEGSLLFRQFLGGLMKYVPEFACFFAPTINAYKRYQPGSWAPTKMAWAFDNRTAGFRVVGKGNGFRIENRMPGADANPYLAFAATIAAGLAGIEEKLDCGQVYHGNAYVDSGLKALPANLAEAADLLARSELAKRVFSPEVVEFYVHTARLEIQAFADAVTDWEKMRYFERI
ncbi:MAG: glutamine synthetase family protein [Verrucomicrobiota bacterium]|nr:glutamine synthetase family protein [Verrucomicrobiota bacterium]